MFFLFLIFRDNQESKLLFFCMMYALLILHKALAYVLKAPLWHLKNLFVEFLKLELLNEAKK